jgi:hypothetical protein
MPAANRMFEMKPAGASRVDDPPSSCVNHAQGRLEEADMRLIRLVTLVALALIAADMAQAAGRDTGYYVEFRARPSQAFGHSYVQVGRDDGTGRSRPTLTAGLYPKSSKAVFDTVGKVTRTAPDLRSQPTVAYKVAVSRETYRTTGAYLARTANNQRYDLIGENCNHLVGRVAAKLGLADPGDHADLPENYVRSLRSRNGGRERASWRK